MEVILKESIESLGNAGDIVKVKPGYARNYLIPKGKAILADKKNVKALERQRNKILEIAAKQKEEFEALRIKLEELTIEIPVRVGEEDKLYGSVTNLDIAKAIEEKGYEVDRKKIILDEPIKSLGTHDVKVKISPEVVATIKVNVVPVQ
ncbi:LSU ribosomal protein L9p [Dissulfuribacter thermophilus]|uniref:Large ribosomal subunit protein bL9 n=1 Tax=Dissulfuribacter thermophilus TaxID=1156395 RepID=A0A1B9F7E8_9BACT|nr:50S ribosomal protein L9 [Dissulfuribacter thermophilus]OCC15813.1 LSU ribosomal protein L9p [Dissulfuribacter thermophilus]